MSARENIAKVGLGTNYLCVKGYDKIFGEAPLRTQFIGMDEKYGYLTLYRPHRLQNLYDMHQALPGIGWIGKTIKVKTHANSWSLRREYFNIGEEGMIQRGHVVYQLGNDDLRDIYYIAVLPTPIREGLAERMRRA